MMKISHDVKVNMVNGSLTQVYFEPVRGAKRPIARIELIGGMWDVWGASVWNSDTIGRFDSRSDAIKAATAVGHEIAPHIFAEFEA